MRPSITTASGPSSQGATPVGQFFRNVSYGKRGISQGQAPVGLGDCWCGDVAAWGDLESRCAGRYRTCTATPTHHARAWPASMPCRIASLASTPIGW